MHAILSMYSNTYAQIQHLCNTENKWYLRFQKTIDFVYTLNTHQSCKHNVLGANPTKVNETYFQLDMHRTVLFKRVYCGGTLTFISGLQALPNAIKTDV